MAQLLGQKNSTLQGSLAIDSARAGATRKKWSTTYLVKGTTDEDEEDILTHGALPQLHRTYRNGYCTRKSATESTEVAGGFLWEVKCDFDSHIDADLPVLKISWDVEEQEVTQYYDAVTGALLRNSAGQPIFVQQPQSIPILTIQRTESLNRFSASLVLFYNNTVNLYSFFGAPPYCARMIGPTARRIALNNVPYWEVIYRIKFNMGINPRTLQAQGWLANMLDRGWWFKNAEGKKEAAETDVDQEPYECLLDGNGHKLEDGQPPVFLPYNKYVIRDFTPLGLEE